MKLERLRDQLRLQAGFNGCPALLAITGNGKTAVATMREQIPHNLLPIMELDALGVPTADEMTRCWDSPRGWQKMMTYHCIYTARHVYRMRPIVVLHGEFDPQYAIAACAAHRVRQHVVLFENGNKEWAENARSLGGTILDPSTDPLEALCSIALELVASAP